MPLLKSPGGPDVGPPVAGQENWLETGENYTIGRREKKARLFLVGLNLSDGNLTSG
jgi:hypothetical protein